MRNFRQGSGGGRRGLALVVVLSLVALLSLLVVAILESSRVELRAGENLAGQVRAEQLEGLATNVVIGQLRKATEGLPAGETWASQPGMVRRYGGGEAGRATGHYKLYSAERLVEGGGFDVESDLPSGEWRDRPERYVDINAPRVDLGEMRFPVVDPRAVGDVAGFDYDAGVRGVVKGGEIDGLRLPMPLRWIYVLRDGGMGVLGEDGRYVGQGVASRDNPIEGRIAFWTDDESCKVNVNTASEGVYWSPPYGYTITERSKSNANSDWVTGMPVAPFGYATSIPLRNEFQRMPGHPAGSSLSAVLGGWLPVGQHPAPGENVSAYYERLTGELASYYGILPRVTDGGSRGGTVWTGYGPHVQMMAIPRERLFGTADEFLFRPERVVADGRLGEGELGQADFFLTSQSRAPEVTLGNKPRVSLWPIMRESQWRSSIDALIAKCATVGKRPYFWQRHSHWTSYFDPGSAQIPSREYQGLARNRDLYAMLLAQMRAPVPGYGGGSFREKYGDDHAQILTSMVDYVRSSVATVPNGLTPHYWYSAARPSWPGVSAAAPGEGSVVPLSIDVDGVSTRGYGRFVTVTEGALLLHAARDPADPGAQPPAGQARHVRAVFMIEPFSPSIGLPSWGPNVRYVVRGLDQFRVNGQSLGFRPEISIVGEVPIGYYDGLAHNNVAFVGFYQLFRRYTSGPNSTANAGRVLGTDERNNYTLYGEATLTIPPGTESLSFTGGEIQIELRSGHEAAPGTLLQTVRMDFPSSAAWPVPRVGSGSDPFATDGALPQFTDFNQRMAGAGNMDSYQMRIIQRGDVVKAVEARADAPLGGDLRLLSAMRSVPKEMFAPHPRYHSSSYDDGRFAHSLRNDRNTFQGQVGWRNRNAGSEGAPWGQDYIVGPFWTGWDWRPSTWSTAGAILPGRVHFRDHAPAVARGLDGAFRADGRLGDWETGHGITPDGCYIRKAHEGSVVRGKGDAGYFVHLQGSEGGDWSAGMDGQANHYPNRQIASAVQFGAIPSGVLARRPFETLLFCPNPAGRTTPALGRPGESDHRGFVNPPDHLLLDLFWMPVVEPYAVSEPFSTAGKINMNYQIAPHGYIKRRTGIHAVMDKLRVSAIPSEALQGFQGSWSYKQSAPCRGEFRYDISLDPESGTLKGFEERFAGGEIFRSATEICDIFLVPKRRPLPPENYSTWAPVADPSYQDVVAWWSNFQLTGDNVREDPYNHLYPRLTTKSNVFQVHYRVQVLKKARGSMPDGWDEEIDRVVAERRGSQVIERFIDPEDVRLPDFARDESASADDWYQFRILSRRSF
jgi:uncharacterized protein (TIGR02600 family)